MEASLTVAGVTALLGLGLIFGLKHATDVDHVVAVSTIVSEHRSVWRSAIVGGLWGAGHTAALLFVGLALLVFRLPLPSLVASGLEFGVALMIIGLGVLTVVRVLRKRADVHIHRHTHDGESHVHIHFHEQGTEHESAAHPAADSHLALTRSFPPRFETAAGGSDARTGWFCRSDVAGVNSNQVCGIGDALSWSLWFWFDAGHAFDVQLNWIALRV